MDGESTDQTMEIIEKYRDRIDIIIHEKDNGQADAINKGFKLAKGELVGWLNSDDILYPDCVERIVELSRSKPDGTIYYCSMINWVNENGDFVCSKHAIIPNRRYLLNKNSSIIQPGSFYPTESIKKINYLNENIHYCMDLDLWLRLLENGNIYCLADKSYSAFRIYNGTKTDTGKMNFAKNIREILLINGGKWYSRNILVGYYFYYLKHIAKKFIYG